MRLYRNSPWNSLKRFLQSPWVITGELLGLAGLGVLSTLVPQAHDLGAAARLAALPGWVRRLVELLALDRILHGPIFLAVLSLAFASLALVIVELSRRARREWATPDAASVLRRAQHREHFALDLRVEARERVEVSARWGLLGAPLFHLGLLVVVLAGALRALFGVDAVGQVYEGETVPAGPAAFPSQTAGLLAAPFGLQVGFTMERLEPELHATGGLAALAAKLRIDREEAPRRVAINEPLDLGPDRLYATAVSGPAALVVWETPGAVRRLAVLLEVEGPRASARQAVDSELELRFAAAWDGPGQVPRRLEYRLLRRGLLAGVGHLDRGGSVDLPGGARLTLVDLRRWLELRGRRDPSVGLVFIGFVMAIAGAAALFLVTRVEAAIRVEEAANGVTVTIGLRSAAFAPLQTERLESFKRRWVERLRREAKTP